MKNMCFKKGKESCQYLQSLRKGSVTRAMSVKPLLCNDIISKGILGNGTTTTSSEPDKFFQLQQGKGTTKCRHVMVANGQKFNP
jgi:hypothetical protein